MLRELNDVWEIHDGRVRAVGDAPLIDDLLKNKLVEVRKGNWAVLYRHEETGEFWDLTYPQGWMQGGGPRRLRVVTSPDDWIPYPQERPSRR
jgi:hypothetical protein